MNCNVIQDLLPLYIDACCSKESAELLEEHLKSCSECRKVYECMQEACTSQPVAQPDIKLRSVSDWKASVLQSIMLFVSFSVITFGVIMEGSTPAGPKNGLWATALIVPATGYLLSLANWFFLRSYPNRKAFSDCSCLVTLGITVLGYVWAAVHYAGSISVRSPLVWFGAALSVMFCVLSRLLSNQYALLLGRE